MGEWDHSRLQALLLKHLLRYEDEAGLLAVPELRAQVRASRFRVLDICVLAGDPKEQVLTRPPLLVIEIVSPEDSMQERIDDYVAFGVENTWIVDPRRKKAYWADQRGVHEWPSAVLETKGAPIRIDLGPLWPA